MPIHLPDLIALPVEAKTHLDNGHTIESPRESSNFVACSCGLSFRIGIIIDKTTLALGCVAQSGNEQQPYPWVSEIIAAKL